MERITGKELKEIYSTLNIRDEFISPFLEIIIKQQNTNIK
jgi:hypothetical protein